MDHFLPHNYVYKVIYIVIYILFSIYITFLSFVPPVGRGYIVLQYQLTGCMLYCFTCAY